MKIGIYYREEFLSDSEYIRVLKHEIIHTKLNLVLKEYMMPVIYIIPHEEKEGIWFEGHCIFNFRFNFISFFLFIKILLCTFADSLFDFISYIFEPKINKILKMVLKNSVFIFYYLLRALNIIKIETHLRYYHKYLENQEFSDFININS